MHRLAIVYVCAVLGCGNSGDAKPATSAGSAAAAPAPAAAAPAQPAAAPPCLVGSWDGKDLVAKIRGATRSLARAGLTQTGGTITFEFRAPGPDGKGDVVVHADKLVHRLTLGDAGLKVSGTVTIDGTQTMPYTFGPAVDALALAPPSQGKIPVRAVVKTSGLVNTQSTETGALDLHDEFVYECAGTTLQLWKRSSSGERRGTPLRLERM